jgi:hypothetical protein
MTFLFPIQIFLNNKSRRVLHRHFHDYIECLDLHLKKLVLINYRGFTRDVEFAKFFLLNARVLEVLECTTRCRKCDAEWISQQRSKVQLERRASQDVRFVMAHASYVSDHIHIRHIHDLTFDDPFDNSSCGCKTIEYLWVGVWGLFCCVMLSANYRWHL